MGYKTCTTCGELSAPATRVCKSCNTRFIIHSTTKKRKLMAPTDRYYSTTTYTSAAVNGTPSVVVIGNVEDHNQDTCAVCNDTGRLLCCDVCPLAYHLDCVQLERVPKGAWQCPACRSGQTTATPAHTAAAASDTSAAIAAASAAVNDVVDVATEMIKVVNGFTFAAYKKLPPKATPTATANAAADADADAATTASTNPPAETSSAAVEAELVTSPLPLVPSSPPPPQHSAPLPTAN